MSTQPAPTHPLIRIRESASIQEAAQLMCDMSMGALGVDGADHQFVGLITERDLMWATAQGKDPFQTLAKEIVNDFPIVVDGPLSSAESARRMIEGHVRHLIVHQSGNLRIVSMRDLLPDCLSLSDVTAPAHAASASELRMMFGGTPAGSKTLIERS
ncbi:MAG: CBS domain-containing protein [Actinomycetota bacterium]